MFVSAFIGTASAQDAAARPQEISDDGRPVILSHMPRPDEVRNSAVFAASVDDLRRVVGNQPVLDLVALTAGTEAAAAVYPEGKLVIVEYINPQFSADADGKFRQKLESLPQNPPVYYRRIGNYSAFVFDAPDESSAAGLLDQVKYEKQVQWLGEDPFDFRKIERAFIYTARDIFVSTILFIVFGIIGSIVAGIGAGFVFFRVREGQRAQRTAFSDAGGLTRLNLDDLSESAPGK